MAATPATAPAPSRCLTGSQPRCAALRSPSSLAAAAPPAGLRPCRRRALSVRAKVASGVKSASVLDDGVERPWKLSDARLVLEDGSVWNAKSFGASGTQVGEVVFNTSLTGYQEILTDPSYAGQFVLMTNPHIGNTGVNPDDEESSRCFLGGLIIRNLSICTSNWRCKETLEEYLIKRNIMGIYDVDTRAITRRLREDGSLIGVLSTDQSRTDAELLEMAQKWKIVGVDLISGVTCDAPYEWSDKTDSEWEFKKSQSSETFHVVAYDFGIKHNIMRRLTSYGCKITVVPANWPASEVLKLKPDGVLFSNGPGDPAAVPYAVKTVQEIIGKVPVFGICMGHQLIGQALGGKTFKMKFGHHGGNHPVCDLRHNSPKHTLHQAKKQELNMSWFGHHHNQPAPPASGPNQVFKIFCRANENYCLAVRDGAVVLAPANPKDEHQHWYKDMRFSTRVKDEEGMPAFALVNKATGLAIKHSLGQSHPVKLVPFNPAEEEPSVLWTESKDVGKGFRCIRMVNNTRLNFDAFHGDKDHGGVHDGTTVVLWEWCKGDNQSWKILPWGPEALSPAAGLGNASIGGVPVHTVRVFCKAGGDYSLTARNGTVCLAPSNPRDEYQHWIKDMRHSTRIRDEEGYPAFALVNKVTGEAIKHSAGQGHPVKLVPYNPDYQDESVLWTESRDVGDGFRCVRMVNNIYLNFDAFHGDKAHGGVHDGTEVVLWEWAKGDNQRWKILPW